MRRYLAMSIFLQLLSLPLFGGAKEIDVPPAAHKSVAATLALRLRFFNERNDPKAKDWTTSKAEAAQKELDAINKDLERLAAGKASLPLGKTVLMGMQSDLDDSQQPYSLYVPPDYDGSKPFPLAVLLHGQGMFNPLQCNAVPIGKMIVLAPQGRGGMDYMYVGEQDVLQAIDEVKGLLKIDDERVYLCGASMGGAGSFHLASKFPDRFAGIMALCGNTDINVWQKLWKWQTPQDSPIARVRHFLREDTCSITYAENLHNVAIVALQGEADPIVNQLHARNMNERLKQLGHPNFQFHLLPYVTHSISANYELGLKNMVRIAKPARVRYQTAWLRYPGAYWLRIHGIEQRLQHANIDGRADAERKLIDVKTQNVTELSIERAKLPFDGTPAEVFIDAQKVDAAATRFVKNKENNWVAGKAEEARAFPPRKSASMEGPVEHAFMSRFLIIANEDAPRSKWTDENQRMFDAVEMAASDFVAQWKTRFAVPCRRKKLNELSEADIADSNLVFIGDAIPAKIKEKLPLSVQQNGIHFGGKVYNGPNAGAIFCYPNPVNPAKYVVVIHGTTPEAYSDIHVRFGNWFDWVPYDFRRHYDFAIFDDLTSGRHPETFLTWGFFGEDWQLKPELQFNAVPSFRERLLPRVLLKPQTAQAREALPLDEVAPKSNGVTKEYLERNRTLDGSVLQIAGKNFERGLCARFPYALTFDCSGYKRFKATAGVSWDGKTEPSDDRKQSEKVTVKVEADGKTLFEAGERTWRSEPLEIDVDLGGAKSLTLSATGGLSWLNGSFIWANARLEGLAPAEGKPAKDEKKSKKK
ncbi:MAG TPA: alpha/beta fold hydrolase [Planctomycetota bacterium]|nr:alpha/beta fold hydrolase [Planctomycetota bacterium]